MSAIQLNNRAIADIDLKNIYGKKGLGVYRLQFDMTFDPYSGDSDEDKKLVVSNFNTEVYIHQRGQKEAQKLYLGRAIPDKVPLVFEIKTTNYKTHASFILDLSKYQLDLIEELRKGEEITIFINLSCEIKGPDIHTTDKRELRYYVDKSEWLKALKAMQYGDFLLFEIPIPDSKSEIPEKILNHLKSARDHFIKGHYEVTLAKCRYVHDLLTDHLKDLGSIKEADKLYSDNQTKREMSKEDRMLLIRNSVRHFTHLAHHLEDDEDGEEIVFTRKQAETILGLTAAMVSFYFNE